MSLITKTPMSSGPNARPTVPPALNTPTARPFGNWPLTLAAARAMLVPEGWKAADPRPPISSSPNNSQIEWVTPIRLSSVDEATTPRAPTIRLPSLSASAPKNG